MTELETKIYQSISEWEGLKGADIASLIGEEKKTVNSILANSAALKALVYQDGNYKWHMIASRSSLQKAPSDEAVPEPDKDLKNICNYYLNCLTLESSSSVSQFLSSKFDLQYAVLNGLVIDADNDQAAISLLNKINGNRDSKGYLGYPVRIYTVYGTGGRAYKKIAPVFMFPVDYVAGKLEISWTPSINMEVLKGYAGGNTDSLAIELVNLETELGINTPDSEIEIDELVLRLREIRQWNWAEVIDPYNIPTAVELTGFEDGIYNRPIVIAAERESYTQGLESELMILANMPEENYRGTALHAWIKGDFEQVPQDGKKPLLEVLPLNSEQAEAVETALNSDLTIVTGPPGTGKSQVVTDLLVNIAWNGKSALFSSKNNKAVDVVDMRVNGLCRRPVLLRIGSNQYAARLAEIIEGLLSARPNQEDKSEMEYYLKEYNVKIAEANKLLKKKKIIIDARNELDAAEQEFCEYRSTVSDCFWKLDSDDIGKILNAANGFAEAYSMANKENNGFFARLFWGSVEPKRIQARESAANAFNIYSSKYGITSADSRLSSDEVKSLKTEASNFEDALAIAVDYMKTLEKFKSFQSLEDIDKELSANKGSLADIAYKLWDKWLTSQAISFTAAERQEMANYVAAMKLAGDVNLSDNPVLKQQFVKMTQQMTKYLQCWAVTSLSAKSRVPFTAGVFDYVIIDEASQCDIASIIPLLYRAKHAVIIGDPKQLSHISQLSKKQDLALIQKYRIPPSWSYSANSLYALAEGKVRTEDIVLLKDHFRSCAEIIEFSNEVFYDGSLRTATNYRGLTTPTGEKPGIRWINIVGNTVRPNTGSAYNSQEAEAAVKEIKRLLDAGYKGSIGVTTPFRRQAEEIRGILEKKTPELYSRLLKEHEFIADTVHKFQGDERDLMIFSPVVSNGTPESTLGFLNSTGNLFNVAITRARAVLVIVGDFGYCSQCNVSYLNRFAAYYRGLSAGETQRTGKESPALGRDYPWVPNKEQVSEWEEMFYTALFDAGIKTFPQYPADKYKLDLAVLLDDGRKLDIEVDGEKYHRNWNGELCYRDQLRNQRMFELGWDVKRFWVYQIRDDTAWCVQQVAEWINKKY